MSMSDDDGVLGFDDGETQTATTMVRVGSFFNGCVVRPKGG